MVRRFAWLLIVAVAGMPGSSASAQSDQSAATQNYLSAILKGSPSERAAEARARNAARGPESASQATAKGRHHRNGFATPAD